MSLSTQRRRGSWDDAFATLVARVGPAVLDLRGDYTNVAGKASAWIDKSPGVDSGIQADANKQPTIMPNGYKGRNYLDFDRAGGVAANADTMVTGTITGGAAVSTLLFIGDLRAVSNIYRIIETAVGFTGAIGAYVESTRLTGIMNAGTGAQIARGSTTLVINKRYFFAITYPHSTVFSPGATIKMWIGHTPETPTLTSNTVNANTTLRADAMRISKWVLADFYWWDGGMGVLALVPGEPTTAELLALHEGAIVDYGAAA